ncbi:hypothetical protein BDV96DRAFT_240585 [Lophiotrema nucula]|uniref:DUF7587 domain-containing protein n=1 Tax=Lophiotrema nucula TaxID=690887 RepID=A0A6A5YPM1_9PLEO|nr:hypothetical protein BDV96DRAFT_240585 [Lophiotrema nucula]
MGTNQGWKLDERFDNLKISIFKPRDVDTKSDVNLKDSIRDFEHDDILENATTEALPWDGSGALVRIKQEPTGSSKAPSSVTMSALSDTINGDLLTPPKSDRQRSSGLDLDNNIFCQLQLFAVPADQSTPDSGLLSTGARESELGAFSDDDNEESSPTSAPDTPCPPKTKSSTTIIKQFVPERPPRTFIVPLKGGNATRHVQRRAKSKSVFKTPKAIERVPSHKWQSDERELLCILYRWYRCRDDYQTTETISTLFNVITGLSLRHRVIKQQFKDHLCLYGASAYPEFARAFVQTPFNDPNGQYARMHKIIEDEAQKNGIELRRREEDVRFENGKAARAKSEYTRRIYKRLVRTASQSSQSSLEGPSGLCSQRPLHGSAILVNPGDEVDNFVDVEDEATSSSATACVPAQRSRPHLAFRIFNGDNKTVLKSFGFQAARFAHLDGLLEENAPLDFPELFHSHAIRHLNHDGGDAESAFVSVFVNLLQTLCSAPASDAFIAVIDLNHPSLTEGGNKLHFAYDLLKELKEKKLVPHAKGRNGYSSYLGLCEYVRWGDWPAASFIHVFPMRELEQLVAENIHMASLLHLDLLQEYSTGTAAKHLREKNFILNNSMARAMGKLAKVFGLSDENATIHHITEFVRHLVEGWTIKATSIDDLQTLSDISFHFAVSFGSQRPIQTIMGAFMDGLREGMEVLERYRPRRRS